MCGNCPLHIGQNVCAVVADDLLHSAVERQFIIVGEAVLQALRLEPSLESSISHARRIVNFRNVIVHGYSQIKMETVWGIVEGELPTLQAEIGALLRAQSPQ